MKGDGLTRDLIAEKMFVASGHFGPAVPLGVGVSGQRFGAEPVGAPGTGSRIGWRAIICQPAAPFTQT